MNLVFFTQTSLIKSAYLLCLTYNLGFLGSVQFHEFALILERGFIKTIKKIQFNFHTCLRLFLPKKKKVMNKNGLVLNLVNTVILMMYEATDQALWDNKVGREGMELGKSLFLLEIKNVFSYFNRTLPQSPTEE